MSTASWPVQPVGKHTSEDSSRRPTRISSAAGPLRLGRSNDAKVAARTKHLRNVARSAFLSEYGARRHVNGGLSFGSGPLEGRDTFKPFKHLEVRPDGGLGHLTSVRGNEPWPKPGKYVAVALGYITLFFNIFMVLRSAHIARGEIAAGNLWQNSARAAREVIESKSLLRARKWLRRRSPAAAADGAREAGRRRDFRKVQVGFLPPAWRQVVVSSFEVGGLLYYLVLMLEAGCRARRRDQSEDDDNYTSWEATVTIFWNIIPSLRSFSALRALKHVHPQLFPAELRSAIFKYSQGLRSKRQMCMMIFLFVLKRLAILWFGLQAFMYKFTQTAHALEKNEGRPMIQLLFCLAFMNQMIGGVVAMDIQFRNRLMLFLFGGEDAMIDPGEDAVMHVWHAHVAHALRQRAFASYTRPAARSGRRNSDASSSPQPELPMTPTQTDAFSIFSQSFVQEAGLQRLQWLRCWIRWVVAISGFDHIDLQKTVLVEGVGHRKEREEMMRRWGLDYQTSPLLD